jgi:hypothetical protein
VKDMTLEEFKSFKRAISKDVVRFNRGEIDKAVFYKNMVITLGKDTFEETIKIMDEDVPQ